MAQEDYLKKQIDQLGLVLARLFSDLLGRKEKDQLDDGVETVNQALEDELGLDIQKLVDIPSDTLIDTLKTQKGLTNESLGKLADILLFIADNREGDNKQLHEQCLTIYEHLEKTDTTYVLDRRWKIERIKKVLE
ncbi:hypothetical protein [Parapedobacter lycopersici]|uniref:hypothetical protein n=1 Tax=Parapedobacter lycopersici TaxID=1864939 RepID=UPI003340E269